MSSTPVTNTELVTQIWDSMKYYIHDRRDRRDAATQLIELLNELDFSTSTIESIAAHDAQLRAAWHDYRGGDAIAGDSHAGAESADDDDDDNNLYDDSYGSGDLGYDDDDDDDSDSRW